MIDNNYKVTKKTTSRRNSLVKDLDNIEYVDILVKYFNQQQIDLTFDCTTNDLQSMNFESSADLYSSADLSKTDIHSNEYDFSFEDQNEIDEIKNWNNPYLEYESSNLETSGVSDNVSDITFLVGGDDDQQLGNDQQVTVVSPAKEELRHTTENLTTTTPSSRLNYRCHSNLNLKFNVNVIDKFSSDSQSYVNSDTESSTESVSSFLEDTKTSSSLENYTDSSEVEDEIACSSTISKSTVSNNDDDKRFNYIFDENKDIINFFPKKTSSLAAALIPDKFISSLVNNADSYNTSCLLI